MKNRYFAMVAAAILTLLATGCIVDVKPDRATNPVGTEHTVTMTLRDPELLNEEVLCEILEDFIDGIEEEFPGQEVPAIPLPILCLSEVQTSLELLPELQLLIFEVVSGPNVGQNSLFNGVCEPSCASLQEKTSWTYRSNGVAGTDVIRACVNFEALLDEVFPDPEVNSALSPEEEEELLEDLLVDAVNDALGTRYETYLDFFCQLVSKTWTDRTPNIGAGLSGLFAGQPTPLPTAAAPAPAAPSPVIRPPSTGDAGIK